MVLPHLGSVQNERSENIDISLQTVYILSFFKSLKKLTHEDWVDFVRYDTQVPGSDIVRTVNGTYQLTILS